MSAHPEPTASGPPRPRVRAKRALVFVLLTCTVIAAVSAAVALGLSRGSSHGQATGRTKPAAAPSARASGNAAIPKRPAGAVSLPPAVVARLAKYATSPSLTVEQQILLQTSELKGWRVSSGSQPMFGKGVTAVFDAASAWHLGNYGLIQATTSNGQRWEVYVTNWKGIWYIWALEAMR